MDLCIEPLEFKTGEWISRQHNNQSKCQQHPVTTAGIRCSFEQTTRKNSDRGMSSIRQQPDPLGLFEPDPFGLNEPNPFGFMKLNHCKIAQICYHPNLCCTRNRKTQTKLTKTRTYQNEGSYKNQQPANTNLDPTKISNHHKTTKIQHKQRSTKEKQTHKDLEWNMSPNQVNTAKTESERTTTRPPSQNNRRQEQPHTTRSLRHERSGSSRRRIN